MKYIACIFLKEGITEKEPSPMDGVDYHTLSSGIEYIDIYLKQGISDFLVFGSTDNKSVDFACEQGLIKNFIKVAKTRKWWDNTLIIIIADHGSTRPGNSENSDKNRYHIPMIWLGGALNVHDTVISNLASQTDLAATLLAQLQLKSDDFKFSKNIVASNYIPYSFFTFTGGFGFQKPGYLKVFNTITNSYIEPAQKADSINEMQGKAYLQSVYMDVFNKNK